MKMQKSSNKPIRVSLFSLLMLICGSCLMAQTAIADRLKDVTVPNNNSVSKLYVELKGGDGGNATTGKCRAYGGTGALVKAVFEVGAGNNQIPPGSTLRFIKGEKGESENFQETAGAGDAGGAGGGGSAVLYRKPGSTSDNDWQILAVAGGGGGAYSGIFAWSCTDTDDGKGGTSTTSGGDGKVKGVGNTQGGTNGDYGVSMTNMLDYGNITSGGGAGANQSAEKPNAGAAAQKGYPSGGSGGHCPGCQTGGFGFGGGGMAFYGPGGGGGYSGGGAGSIDYAGGGGSYTSNIWIGKSVMAGATGGGKNEDGYILYEFDPAPEKIDAILKKPVRPAVAQQKCLDLLNGNTANGANIQLWDCNASDEQAWFFDGPAIRLGKQTGKCIDLSGGNTSNGANIELWDCQAGNKNQVWIYDVVSQYIRSGVNFNKCIDLSKTNTANGANIQLWDCNNTDAQKWLIDGIPSTMPAGTNNSIHLAMASDKCLDVDHSKTANGTNIQLYDCNGSYAQHFIFNGHAIKMAASPTKCLDLNQSSDGNGTNIQLYDCNGTNAQQWIYDGFARSFRSAVNTNKCLDVDHSNTANGTNIQLYDCNGTDAQQFVIGK